MTTEEKKKRVKELRPIDDIFFGVLVKSIPVCQEVLRTILEDENLIVSNVVTQADERNIYGRSVILDALCELGNGTKCNIEVQRADNDNHLKRARFNASSITVRDSQPGTKFDDVLELYVVYISQFDFLKGNKTTYHVEKFLRETGEVIDDGLHEVFVNTAVNDGTDIAELMSCFLRKEVKNEKFPALSREVSRLKETEGGVNSMCEVMEKELREMRVEMARTAIRRGVSKDMVLKFGITEDEYAEAEKEILQKASY